MSSHGYISSRAAEPVQAGPANLGQGASGVFVLVAILAPACGSGDDAVRPVPGGESEAGEASSGASEGGIGGSEGGTCNSCSVDTDCSNDCPLPSRSGYVWCCGSGTCFEWQSVCPPLQDAASSGGPLDGSSDAQVIATCPSSADSDADADGGSSCATGGCLDANWAEWPMPNSSVDVAAGAPNPESYRNNGDGTVTDNVTGLMWQQAPPSTGRTWADAQAYCTSLGLGAYADWRLPTFIELVSIVDYSQNLPAIDPTAFPGATTADTWTATPFQGMTTAAWGIYFMAGDGNHDPVTEAKAARCVRSPLTVASPDSAISRYTVTSGAVYDSRTRLTWQQAPPPDVHSWADAKSYCAGLTLSGMSGWRVPTEKELLTLADVTKDAAPAIDCLSFPGARADAIWSASMFAGSNSLVWTLRFDTAHQLTLDPSSLNAVRCVK